MPKTFRVVIVIFGMAVGLAQRYFAAEVKDKQQFTGRRVGQAVPIRRLGGADGIRNQWDRPPEHHGGSWS